MSRSHSAALILALLTSLPGRVAADAYDPPPSYYSSATGTGSTLKGQLASIMAAGQVQRNYGNFRDSAAITDADPSQPGNILLVYNRASVPATWDSGATWNREHIWPVSLQAGGDPSNTTTGHRGDPHALRPADPGINTSRGNKPFGFEETSGGFGAVAGGYYFPGDADKGDVARQLFYSDSRYGASLGISLTDAVPGSNQMGDLSSLIAWHYLDPPDDFERRRNHTIFSQIENPLYYTNNRSAYVDRPEYVWSVYVDQQNDTQLEIADGVPGSMGNGGSTLMLDLGRVLVGAPTPAGQAVTINKTGVDGTYFSVTPEGGATSSVTGRYNAFAVGAEGSHSFDAGLTASTGAAGEKSGTITIDNLDVTTAGGFGLGANDQDDVITVQFTVFDHANPSFAEVGDVNELTIDFGTVELGAIAQASFRLTNLPSTLDYTASADFDAISGGGDTSAFFTDLTPWAGNQGIFPGEVIEFHADMITSTTGNFSATYALSFSDEDLPGATSLGDLTLNLVGTVMAAPSVSADFDDDGDVDGADLLAWQRGVGITEGAARAQGDANGDGAVDSGDLAVWLSTFGEAPQQLAAVPESTTIVLVALAAMRVTHARRRR